ncbi:MAG: hypothetical protein ACREN4_07150 [Candidatus Dormibacteria bacterium]
MATVDFSAAQLEALRGQLDTEAHTVKVEDRSIGVAEAHAGGVPWTGDGGAGALDFISQTRGSPGFVVDQARAREDTPCLCYELRRREGGTSELCFKHGIVGALDEPQKDLYCEGRELRPPTAAQQARLQDFQDSAEVCKVEVEEYPKGEELDPFLSCMSRELRARNRTLAGTEMSAVPAEGPGFTAPQAAAEGATLAESGPPPAPSPPPGGADQTPLQEAAGAAAASVPDDDEPAPDDGDDEADDDDEPDLGNGDTD